MLYVRTIAAKTCHDNFQLLRPRVETDFPRSFSQWSVQDGGQNKNFRESCFSVC